MAVAEKLRSEKEDYATSLVIENQRHELKSNGVKLMVVRTGQRTVLVKHAEREAQGVGDFEEVAKHL